MAASTPKPFSATPLGAYLSKYGRFPAVALQIKPIDPSRQTIIITQFEEYTFQSSVLIPVDAFSFSARNPTLAGSLYDFIQDGDIAVLLANGVPVATGIIDSVTISTEADTGEVVKIQGRTLIGNLEDQAAVNDKNNQIWFESATPQLVINQIAIFSRISFYRLQQVPAGASYFASEPGESKLSALLRYTEPLNAILWMDPDGTLVMGRPDMGGSAKGTFYMDREKRQANCLSIQAHYASTQIPNQIIPVWTGQESVISRVGPEQYMPNMAAGPARLFRFKHRTSKATVISAPNGSDAQSAEANTTLARAGGSNYLQAYGKRELARANIGEVGVQVNVQGHYNSDLEPLLIDTCYNINYSRASLNEKMYLHTVAYSLSRSAGQKTSLSFCRLGCIVADVSVESKKISSVKTQIPNGGKT